MDRTFGLECARASPGMDCGVVGSVGVFRAVLDDGVALERAETARRLGGRIPLSRHSSI